MWTLVGVILTALLAALGASALAGGLDPVADALYLERGLMIALGLGILAEALCAAVLLVLRHLRERPERPVLARRSNLVLFILALLIPVAAAILDAVQGGSDAVLVIILLIPIAYLPGILAYRNVRAFRLAARRP